jgi:hypothetical protein
MPKHRLPSLPSLSTSGIGLSQIVTPEQLRELGWATGGGAVGAVAGSFLVEQTKKIPLLDKIPGWAHYALFGAVGARLSWGWNADFAKGLAGHMVGGQGVGMLVNGLLGRSVMGQLPEEEMLSQPPELPDEEELSALPSPDMSPEDTDATVDESELGEIEPNQQFRGGFGATVEEQKPLSSWIS